MRRKKIVYGKYTKLGHAIYAVFGSQAKMAKALRVSQQTCSRKLRGECAISVKDLRKIAIKGKTAVIIQVGDTKIVL